MTLSPEEVLSLVTDGGLTLLHRPDWLSGRDMEDLHAANGGCSNAAMRLAPALADEWTWRIGYDNLAEMAWRKDPEVIIRVISLSPAHALLMATLQAVVYGPDGIKSRAGNQPLA